MAFGKDRERDQPTQRIEHTIRLDPKLSAQIDKLIAVLEPVDLTKLKAALATQAGLREELEAVLAQQSKT